MNKVILCGRLTDDPDISYLNHEKESLCKARFILAVDRRVKSENNNADFITCVAWRKTAEFIEKYGRKGTKFIVEGSIQTGSYTNKDGNKVYTTDVLVENVEFAESKKQDGPIDTPKEEFMSVPGNIDEELPFK